MWIEVGRLGLQNIMVVEGSRGVIEKERTLMQILANNRNIAFRREDKSVKRENGKLFPDDKHASRRAYD